MRFRALDILKAQTQIQGEYDSAAGSKIIITFALEHMPSSSLAIDLFSHLFLSRSRSARIRCVLLSLYLTSETISALLSSLAFQVRAEKRGFL